MLAVLGALRRAMLRALRGIVAALRTVFRKTEQKKFVLEIVGVCLAAVAAVAAIKYAGVAKDQWEAAREANRIAVAAQRPWLGVSGSVHITKAPQFRFFNPNFTNLNLDGVYRVKNFGTSPALAANGWLMTVVSNDTTTRPNEKTTLILCNNRDTKQGIGEVIFPGSETVFGLNGDQISFGRNIIELRRIWLVGCITYRDTAGNIHHTKFWLRSTYPDDALWVELNPGRPFRHMPITGFESWGQETD